MVVTMLKARVEPDRIEDLERAYREGAKDLPPDIVESFLTRDAADGGAYRIVTVWRSRAALEAMRSSGVTPTGVRIFQAAGATPELTVLDVVIHRRRDDAGRAPVV